jgi:galactokinase
MASSLGGPEQMLFIDTRTLAHHPLALPEGSAILVLDSGLPRALAGSAYNRRREECEEAARLLGVKALRDVDDVRAVEKLPDPLRRRARHVVSENARVLRAASGVDAPGFGALMNASHASLRADFDVSSPALDRLVNLLRRHEDVHGARLTGAGFGGACVALCRKGRATAVARAILRDYATDGGQGRLLVPAAPVAAEG